VAGGKRTAADLGAWLIFEDESGQGLRPPRGRTWGRRGCTPVVKVTGAHNTRVSLAALIATKPGCRPRLIYRVHRSRPRGNDQRKGFTETGYAQLLDAAHQQLGGPIVLVGQPEHPRQRRHEGADRSPVMADGLSAPRLRARAQPGGGSLVASQTVPDQPCQTQHRAQLTALAKTRLKRMQYRPGLLEGFLASTRLDICPWP